jgi:hypothetical protein
MLPLLKKLGAKKDDPVLFEHTVQRKYLYDQTAALTAMFAPFYEDLAKPVHKSLQTYKEYGYEQVNDLLRRKGITKLSFAEYIKHYIEHKHSVKTVKKATEEGIEDIPVTTTMKISKSKSKSKGLTDVLYDTIWRTFKAHLREAQHIDTAFRIAGATMPPLPASIAHLFRGIKHERYNEWVVGETMLFPTYMSTSLSPSVAWTFQGCGTKPCCLFVLKIPKGKRSSLPWIFVPDLHDNRDMEYEVLLPRNTRWKLTKKYAALVNPDSAINCSFQTISAAHPVTIFECTFVDCVFGELHCPDAHSKKELLSFEIHIKTPLLLEEAV